MKKRVKVVATGYYEIDGDALRNGSYGEEIQRLYVVDGAVDEAFDKAMAYDAGNVKDGQFQVEEVLQEGKWEALSFSFVTE